MLSDSNTISYPYVDFSDFLSNTSSYLNCVVVNRDFYFGNKNVSVSWRISFDVDFIINFSFVDFSDYYIFSDSKPLVFNNICVPIDSFCASYIYNLLMSSVLRSFVGTDCSEFYFVIKNGKLHTVGHMVFLDREEVLKHVTK